MTPRMIRLVRGSWTAARPTALDVTDSFYQHLAELDPELKRKFRGILHVLDVAVNQLSCLGALKPVLRSIGERHASQGVEPSHYAMVGCALLQTLQQRLGQEFGEEVREAWIHVYGQLVAEIAGESLETA
jgi:hemoglobin-like flavoprotein